MKQILANYTASITELKKSPTKLLDEAGNEPIAILNHNTPSAYLVPSSYYEKIMDILDEHYLEKEVKEALNYSKDELVEVDIDELI
ncbi:type II toxin-antitoxin system prevent-host-death family antitoxin [Sulfurimonas sp. SWIR-19]|uniref:type II toxin-antitoxin system prevent-host-death family antitoxin n=1 Tax=Sulfurimonas sp. SWIR-19 TaxID=2878390 RepID=UPI001CF31263|nr:type II toxin-antitoxin system prevent-host-death family antitoxin [Sulfurimonas sp. SWIR-19]UCN00218.1 type II toxin-antitoxin system prevent-host-death family antitoxin [Sulfurimonas sp. SWIR-19]